MKKNFWAIALVCIVTVCSFTARATVVEGNKMADALASADKDTLVVFDIDSTILEAAQTLGSDAWYYTVRDRWIAEGMDKAEANKKILDQWREVQRETKVLAVEPGTPDLIKKLQDKGIKTIALTARGFEIADVTAKQLLSIGVDFGRRSLGMKDFGVKSKGGDARYRKGIVFCGGLKIDKGLILNAVLAKARLSPKKVIFVDDKKYNVDAVDGALKSKGIDCNCVRYGAADQSYKTYNQAVADVEMEFFGKILSDDAAGAILKFRKSTHKHK
jgi:phosphoglycolate phosphatase-like HAD superfamily hydrolase